jgi:hypothetical protein
MSDKIRNDTGVEDETAPFFQFFELIEKALEIEEDQLSEALYSPQ